LFTTDQYTRRESDIVAIRTISPVTGEVLKTFDELTPEQLEEKLARAATAAESYRLTSIEQRVECLGRAADRLEKEADSVSELITTEMGKTYRAAQEEVAKCVHGLRFYAAEGPGYLKDRASDAGRVGAKESYVTYHLTGRGATAVTVQPATRPHTCLTIEAGAKGTTRIRSAATDFIVWGTKRRPWRDFCELTGDQAAAVGFLDCLDII
jgi:hypothetical protein